MTNIDPDTGEILFVPEPGFTGDAEVTYTARDADGVLSDPATVQFSVIAPPPVMQPPESFEPLPLALPISAGPLIRPPDARPMPQELSYPVPPTPVVVNSPAVTPLTVGSSGRPLASTGVNHVAALIGVATMLTLGGAVLILVGRRRRTG